jgi:hypothetical protein
MSRLRHRVRALRSHWPISAPIFDAQARLDQRLVYARKGSVWRAWRPFANAEEAINLVRCVHNDSHATMDLAVQFGDVNCFEVNVWHFALPLRSGQTPQ